MNNPDERYLELDEEIADLKRQRDEICRKISRLQAEQEKEKDRLINDFAENGVLPFTDRLTMKKVPQSVIVTDESKIPERFFRVKKELNKADLNKAVKDGEAIEGVCLSNGGWTIARKGA